MDYVVLSKFCHIQKNWSIILMIIGCAMLQDLIDPFNLSIRLGVEAW
jgi:hypothetical protein